MPPIAIMAGIGAAGAGASAAGGKKARNQADRQAQQQLAIQQQQLALQRQQFGLTQEAFNLGKSAWLPARDYWQALMGGGQAARVAVGPSAELIGEVGDATRRTIGENLPRGGERNLATAQSQIGQQRDISRLYAGVQPQAAQMLGALSGQQTGASVGFNPQAQIGLAPNVLSQALYAQQAAQQGAAGFGGLLYQALNKRNQTGSWWGSGSGGITPTPPFVGWGGI